MKIQLFESKLKILVLITVLLSLSACDDLVRPSHDYPDHYYYYHYYPSLNIYHDTRRGLYFYYTDRGWIHSHRLPRRYRLHRHHYEKLRLRERRPYLHHRRHHKHRHHPHKYRHKHDERHYDDRRYNY